jgi:hypothetical protein
MLLVSQLAYAQADSSPEMMVEQTDLMIEYMEQAKIRLRLTDDQAAQIRLILTGDLEKMRGVFQERDIVPGAKLSFRQKVSLARALRPIIKESEKNIKAILSSDQWQDFKNIREETLDEIKARRKAE